MAYQPHHVYCIIVNGSVGDNYHIIEYSPYISNAAMYVLRIALDMHTATPYNPPLSGTGQKF